LHFRGASSAKPIQPFTGHRVLVLVLLVAALCCAASAGAQENYFVTYSTQLEELGNLEIGARNVFGAPRGVNAFAAGALELEYGVKGWWTTELYLDGQTTAGESTLFTGFRWENRIRPLLTEHWINPALYFEFEDINAADKTLLEVVWHDGRNDFMKRSDRHDKQREAELKLILSSDFRGWNLSENIIAEKNLSNEPWEFGYAIGASRPLKLIASAERCSLCRENFAAGAEIYGGLGDRHRFGLSDTSHYLAPVLNWQIPRGPAVKVSPGFGLNDYSHGFLLRFGISCEIEQFVSKFRRQQP